MYYVNERGGVEIGPFYTTSFWMHRYNFIGSFFRRLLLFVKQLLYSGAKAVEKGALKTLSDIITDTLNEEPEQPIGSILEIVSIKQRVTLWKRLKRSRAISWL